MELSRQEYWSGLLFPTPGHLPDPGIESACCSILCLLLWQILYQCATWDDPEDNSDAIYQVIVLSFCMRLFLCKQLHYVDPGHPSCLPK